MRLEDLKTERVQIENSPLFSAYRDHEWEVPMQEKFTRIAEMHKNLVKEISDFERLSMAYVTAKVNAANGQQGEINSAVETEIQKQTRLFTNAEG
jgi:hypothetical protein